MTDAVSSAHTCPRCGSSFTCRADAIGQCACARLTLDPATLAAVRTYTQEAYGHYSCLCIDCLQALQAKLAG